MRVDVVTLFPELFDTFRSTSFVGRAVETAKLEVRLRSPRDFGLGKHKSVDDTPYGGGSGMVMRVDVMVACMESLDDDAPKAKRIVLTPQGRPFDQEKAIALAEEPAIMLVCGRYEGFDERVRNFVDEEISLGDFVMTGGEVARWPSSRRRAPDPRRARQRELDARGVAQPGQRGLLEYPQYTRPAEFSRRRRARGAPLGEPREIAKWRAAQSKERTPCGGRTCWKRRSRCDGSPSRSCIGPCSTRRAES